MAKKIKINQVTINPLLWICRKWLWKKDCKKLLIEATGGLSLTSEANYYKICVYWITFAYMTEIAGIIFLGLLAYRPTLSLAVITLIFWGMTIWMHQIPNQLANTYLLHQIYKEVKK